MNTIQISQTIVRGRLAELTNTIREVCSSFIVKLNSRIDAKPLPSHRRMGSWQRKTK